MGIVLRNFVLLSALAWASGCGGNDATAPGRLPSDAQVIKDVRPKSDDAVLDVSVTAGRRGEAYLHRSDLNWYWDRGVVVRRKAGLDGAPDAVLVVGGLARYQLVGDRYEYQRFLTTYNEYEGAPAPDKGELTRYVLDNLPGVFVGREHRVTEVSAVAPAAAAHWLWHSATSFSVPFQIEYQQITNDTTVETRRDLVDIRFYRETIDGPLNGLLATEKERLQVGKAQFTPEQIRSMKTLRDELATVSQDRGGHRR